MELWDVFRNIHRRLPYYQCFYFTKLNFPIQFPWNFHQENFQTHFSFNNLNPEPKWTWAPTSRISLNFHRSLLIIIFKWFQVALLPFSAFYFQRKSGKILVNILLAANQQSFNRHEINCIWRTPQCKYPVMHFHDIMDLSPFTWNLKKFKIGKNITTAWKSILCLVKLQSSAVKCCKM